jgi:tetratricopeptide (TPR) repeat protein
MFYLNSNDSDYSLFFNEITEILRLKKAVILIDNFYTPGKPFEYSMQRGERMDLNCIKKLIDGRVDNIYYAAIANGDNRGMALIFAGYENEDINKLKGLPLISESLRDGKLLLLGRSGRVLMMGAGKHRMRTLLPTLSFENYLSDCMSGYEVVTFGYNEGVDIRINVDDDFNEVIKALPNGWIPDVCILAGCEYGLIPPSGLETAPFLTVYITYDWNYHVHTTKTFVEMVDITISAGDFSFNALNSLNANSMDRFYVHGLEEKFFSLSTKKLKDRKYDILYATGIDDKRWPDRSEWILKLCELADKYKVYIATQTNYYNYQKLLKETKLAFSHTKLGDMSPRIFDAASQGAVTLDTGHAVKNHFHQDHEFIAVTKENISEQVDRHLQDIDKLQEVADRVQSKVLNQFDPRKLFAGFLGRLYEHLDNKTIYNRNFNKLSDSEKHIRRAEMYYFSFWIGVDGWGWLNNYKNLLKLSIGEFRKAVAADPDQRSMIGLAIAEASHYFFNRKKDGLHGKEEDIIHSFEEIISKYPSNPIAFFNLGLANLRLGKHDRALNSFMNALKFLNDPDIQIDPWHLYHTEIEPDFKSSYTYGKKLNSELVLYSMGEKESLYKIRELYKAAANYYVSLIYDDMGRIYESTEKLLESYNAQNDFAIVVEQAAKRLSILDFREESLAAYNRAIELMPLNLALRIEYLKLMYLYGMDEEVMSEIKYIFKIIRKIDMFSFSIVDLNTTIDSFARYGNSSIYSHDSCRETMLNSYNEVLYTYLNRNPKDMRLIHRITAIWDELGRADKILELVENYVYEHMDGNISVEDITALNNIYNYLQEVNGLQEADITRRTAKLTNLVSKAHPDSRMKIGT